MTKLMDVRLLVRLEDGTDGSLVWWGEVPEVPGFSVTSSGLRDLVSRAQWALADVLAETDEILGRVDISIVGDDAPPVGTLLVREDQPDDLGPTTGDGVRVSSVTRTPVSAGA